MRTPHHYPLSWTLIRNFTEKFQWLDPSDGSTREGFNPPPSAVNKQRKPYDICYITSKGIVERGRVVTLTVKPHLHQRMVRFIDSNQVRMVRDYLVVCVDDVYFRTH